MGAYGLSKKGRQIAEVVCLVTVISVTVALFALPVIFHHVKLTSFNDKTTSNVSQPINITRCSNQSVIERVPGVQKCISEVYIGQSCMQELAMSQMCTLGIKAQVMLNGIGLLQQQQNEQNIVTLLRVLSNSAQECIDAAVPFLCQYLFPLCDNTTGELYLPTQEECLRISEQVCSQEWNLAKLSGFGDRLPDCSRLPLQTGSGDVTQPSMNNSTDTNITCRDDFINLNNSCHPRCDRWTTQESNVVAIERAAIFIASITGLLGGSIFLVIAAVRHKHSFAFPAILLVYVTTEAFISAFFALLAEAGSVTLLCSSVTIADSINNPTALCTIIGAVFHYTLVSMTLFWFFHVCMVFYKVVFPVQSMTYKSYDKYIHVVMAALGFLLPLPAVIVALVGEDYKYTIGGFPPSVCITRNSDLLFYSTNLVSDILLAAATCFLIIIFWKVHKHQGVFGRKKEGQLISTAEKKLLFVLCYYSLFGVTALINFALFTARRDAAVTATTQYFICEASGHVPGKCDRASFEENVNTWWLFSLTFLLLGFLPIVNLTFVINFRKAREKFTHCHFYQQKSYRENHQ